MGELLKLSEVSKRCGIKVRTLQFLVADGLLPAERTPHGHPLIPDDAVPTWAQCRALLEQHRDRHLQQAAKMLDRVLLELEAVRNDITEAREHPTEPLGIDFTAASRYSSGSGQTTLAAALTQFEHARINVELYHRALIGVIDADRT